MMTLHARVVLSLSACAVIFPRKHMRLSTIHLITLNNSSTATLLKSRYVILLICTWKWPFIGEQKSTAGKVCRCNALFTP